MESEKKKQPYNSLDKINLGKSVANAILSQEYSSLPPERFYGVGIYAIYYFGDDPLYKLISDYNKANKVGWPLYVGKAIPKGGRKGPLSQGDKSTSLFERLRKHSKTILAVDNLEIDDFKCKHLTIDSIWIPLGEQLLIDKYKPLWNSSIDGFGNNDPGGRRYSGAIPDWHLLHPGVEWVKRMDDFSENPNVEKIKREDNVSTA
jgi:hypothetical protein